MTTQCAQHPDTTPLYRCDGCGRSLCGDCIQESHALLLCGFCGELAVPLEADRPASVQGLRQQRVREAPYSIGQALAYPFRGMGLFLFVATVTCFALLWLMSWVAGCAALILQAGLWMLIVRLQFKIVRTTADGKTELPDWPDFLEFDEGLRDILTWLAIHSVQAFAMLALGLLLASSPSILAWLLAVPLLWLGSAFTMMAYGAAGTYTRLKALAIPQHIKGFFAAGADAVQITSLFFGLGIAILAVQGILEASVPVLGLALSGVIGVYWIFLVPHLAGLLFRRHHAVLERLYWP